MQFKLEHDYKGECIYMATLCRQKEGWFDLYLFFDLNSKEAKAKMDGGNYDGPEMEIPWSVGLYLLETTNSEIPNKLYEK